MVTNDVVNYHLREVLHAVLVEIDGDLGLSQCLRAETKMRLISMSEEELSLTESPVLLTRHFRKYA